ncbi:HAMP domain-containing sensor histidine kinase [Rivularia sp. UHCC 0363]|uniref:sensor histidine kinase n=1 Tax=Rivularia sp. UHCC 0363 TaxID=3110244 RepID=UPI002B1EDC89|nr:HAMP domain-containing sensor histidine kinase [Rivularia sp. UHCC 0363]MEA5594413.1 HAMP domain-containing sensor histidine kinase [Rivularia sp. UHCC 0363]
MLNKQINRLQPLIQSYSSRQWLIVAIFILVVILEYFTPPIYVFGYLYIGAVLLANSRLSQKTTFWVTTSAIAFTILNLIIPGVETITLPTVANRLIVVAALIVTGWLSNRNRSYEEAIARQKMQILAQEKMASLREDFASTLTHDLQTPLLGALETLKAFESEKFGAITATQQKVLQVMRRSHQNTLELVQTLLDVYRNDTQGLQLRCSSIDLVTVANSAISTLIDLASSRQVYIHFGFADSEFRSRAIVNGDALQLQRVFVNLIANGINHSLRGGKVEVVFIPNGINHTVKIIDQGQGITQEELPLLFERFYQGHTHRQAKGAGLGLYLSRQIIEAHNGKIWVERGKKSGAIFGFSLPAFVHN